MILRQAEAGDSAAIHQLHSAAFARPGVDVPVEAPLVRWLDEDGDLVPALTLVAEIDGRVVGHVAGSRGRLGDHQLIGLGPLGVLPAYQQQGVGSALMHAVIAAADALEVPAVILLGDPGYYRRFGFELAGRHSVQPQVPEWAEHFQIRRLQAWDEAIAGTFRYARAFERT